MESLLIIITVIIFGLLVRHIRWLRRELRGIKAEVIAERRRLSDALSRTEERYLAVVQSSADGIFLVDVDSRRIMEANPALEQMLGYTLHELVNTRIDDIIVHGFSNRQARPDDFIGEHEYQRKDGRLITIEGSANRVRLRRRDALCVIVRDISNRKQVALERARFRAVMDQAGEGVYIADFLNGQIVDANQTGCKMLGYTRDELLQLQFQRIEIGNSLYNTEQWRAQTIQIQEAGEPRLLTQSTMQRRDGSTFPAGVSVAVREFEGREYVLAVVRDITERQRKEEELEAAKNAAEAANRSKTAFLANMSHELRTPLNAVIGMSQVLLMNHIGPLNDMQGQYCNDILECGRHLLTLINDILDMSKIENSRLELVLQPVNLPDLLADSLGMIRARARTANITLQTELDESLLPVRADRNRLMQIVSNLLSNAVKFTPENGYVGIRLYREYDRAKVEVWDTGIGITPENQARLFRPFERLEDSSPSRQFEGTGLGLALCKQLVELHSGEIGVFSQGEGEGSTFWFTLPFDHTPEVAHS